MRWVCGYSVVMVSALQQWPTSPSYSMFIRSGLFPQPVGLAIVGQSVELAVMVPYRSDEAFGLDILCGSVMVMIRVIVGFGVSTQRIVILLKCNGKKRLNTGAMEVFLSVGALAVRLLS